MTDPRSAAVAQRRARVAELTRDKKSIRKIAEELGVSKDVVFRDRLRNAKTRRAVFRDNAAQARDAMERLHAAVTATAAARPAHQVLVDDTTAARWIAQLRADAAALLAVADTFRDYYPHLTDPTAIPDP